MHRIENALSKPQRIITVSAIGSIKVYVVVGKSPLNRNFVAQNTSRSETAKTTAKKNKSVNLYCRKDINLPFFALL